MLSEPLEVSAAKAQAVYDKGPWPRFFFTKGGKGGIARKTYLDNVGGKLPTVFQAGRIALPLNHPLDALIGHIPADVILVVGAENKSIWIT